MRVTHQFSVWLCEEGSHRDLFPNRPRKGVNLRTTMWGSCVTNWGRGSLIEATNSTDEHYFQCSNDSQLVTIICKKAVVCDPGIDLFEKRMLLLPPGHVTATQKLAT